MARKTRIQFFGTYHVTTRGDGGQKIFREFQDYERLSFLMTQFAATAAITMLRKSIKKIANKYSFIQA